MNEYDDSDIIEDIQALEKALAFNVKEEPLQQQCDYNNHLLSSDCITSISSETNNLDDYLDTNRNIDTDQESLNAYEINTRLIVGLTIAKQKLTVILQECEQKIKSLDEEMTCADVSSLRTKCSFNIIGIPYFKDKNNFFPPKNDDTKLKEARGELLLLSLKKPNRWSEKDRDILLRSVHNQAIESVLSTDLNNKIDDEELIKRKQDDQDKKAKFVLPKSFNELVGSLGEREFDWYKISVTDFDNKHSPEECRAMWNVYLHPQIRKSEWTSTEDKKLLRYAKEHRFQDWDAITLKLGTNRSAYQCFIRYNTIKKVPSTGRTWSKAEDQHLVTIVNSLKIGNYIPWSEIANYLWHRTKQQIYSRWMYRKAPHLKKGRFNSAETETLLKAIKKYGKDFPKISNTVMPSRTSIQLNEHYCMLIRNQNGENIWTINDDMILINSHKKYGNNWSKIAKCFDSKTRTQVRQRFNSLVKYTKKGISIECIPRQHSTSYKDIFNNKLLLESHDKDISIIEKIPTIETADIQLKLYETFCFPLSMKANNSQYEFYDLGQLLCETKKLYNILNLLNVNLNVPYNFLNYIHVDRREKQLLISLKKYIERNKIQNDEIIENLRLRMFGNNQKVSENSHFIPPIPFCGHSRKRKVENKMPRSIDCIIDINQKFLIDISTEFCENPDIELFISIEERKKFDKFSQLLTNSYDYYNHERQNINLHKLQYNFFFNEKNKEYYTQMEQSNNLHETIEYLNKDNEKTLNDVILPNRATLLGLKNLLLWKLLYEYQITSDKSSNSIKKSDQIIHSKQNNEYEKAYKLLRTRLYQLFKFPISLSNTTLEICGPDTVFFSEEANQQTLEKVSRKRKNISISNKKANILVDSNFQQNTSIKTVDLPNSSKVICKKYKIVAK